MKKYSLLFLVLVVVVMTFALTACSGGTGTTTDTTGDTGTTDTAADPSWQNIQDKGELVIGLDDNYPPIGFHDANGELVGSDIDLAKAACEKMGVKATFKPVEWDGVLLSLKNGDIDVIWNGLGVTEERAKEIDYSRVYMTFDNIIITNLDSTIATLDDLKGKTLGTQLGSSAEVAITSNAIAGELKELRKYGSYAEALLDLQAGRLDAVLTDNCNGLYLMASQGMTDSFKVLNVELQPEPIAVGVRKGETALADKINEALDAVTADGTSKEISQKWFGTDDFIQ